VLRDGWVVLNGVHGARSDAELHRIYRGVCMALNNFVLFASSISNRERSPVPIYQVRTRLVVFALMILVAIVRRYTVLLDLWPPAALLLRCANFFSPALWLRACLCVMNGAHF
jgi:hypothetical protein